MSTTSMIGYKRKDGKIESIEVRRDGNAKSIGKVLYTGYKTLKKVKEILEIGDLDQLGFMPRTDVDKKNEFPISNKIKSTLFQNEIDKALIKIKIKYKGKVPQGVMHYINLFKSGKDEEIESFYKRTMGDKDFDILRDHLSEKANQIIGHPRDYGRTIPSQSKREFEVKKQVFASLKAFIQYGKKSGIQWLYLAVPDQDGKLEWKVGKFKQVEPEIDLNSLVNLRDAISYKKDPAVKMEAEQLAMIEDFEPELKAFSHYLEEVYEEASKKTKIKNLADAEKKFLDLKVGDRVRFSWASTVRKGKNIGGIKHEILSGVIEDRKKFGSSDEVYYVVKPHGGSMRIKMHKPDNNSENKMPTFIDSF